MRLIYALVLLAGLALPARADDAALKKEVGATGAQPMKSLLQTRKIQSCIAALYTSDGIYRSTPQGSTTTGRPARVTPALFQAGFTKLDATTVQETHAGGRGRRDCRRAPTMSPARIRRTARIWSPMGPGPPPTSEDGGKLKVRMLTGGAQAATGQVGTRKSEPQ